MIDTCIRVVYCVKPSIYLSISGRQTDNLVPDTRRNEGTNIAPLPSEFQPFCFSERPWPRRPMSARSDAKLEAVVHYTVYATGRPPTLALPERVPAVLLLVPPFGPTHVSAQRGEAIVLRCPPPRPTVPALLLLPLPLLLPLLLLPLLLLLLLLRLGLGLGLLVRRGLAPIAPCLAAACQLEVDIVPGLVSRVSK